MNCYIIAEAGVNHNGSAQTARALIDVAADAGADAVKFQTFKTESVVTAFAPKAAYQKDHTGEGNQWEMIKSLELSYAEFESLADYCQHKGIEFLSTPFDMESAAFLVNLGCQRLKIPSGEITNIPFLRYLASHDLAMILSTGMADLDDITLAIKTVEDVRQSCGFTAPLPEVLTLLHCTTSYPTPLHQVNLRAMQTLAEHFDLPVGYSDHSEGIAVAPLARALGAVVFEKHITLDNTMVGPDHAASLEPDALAQMVRTIRDVDTIMGSEKKAPTLDEIAMRDVARRSITLTRDVSAGVPIQSDDLVILRPGHGIAPKYLDEMMGRTLQRNMPRGTTLTWEDLS